MRGSYFVGEVAVWFCLKLVHDDAQNATTALVGAATGRFHHTQVAARADRETSISQKRAHPPRLAIFGIGFATFGPAKNRYDPFLRVVGHSSGWCLPDSFSELFSIQTAKQTPVLTLMKIE